MSAMATRQSKVLDPLSSMRMSECERQAARAHLRQGERIADLLIAAIAAMRGVTRAFRSLARTRPAN